MKITYETVCEKLGFPIEDMAKHFRIPKDVTEDMMFETPIDNLSFEERDFVSTYMKEHNIVITEEMCEKN